MSGALDSRSNAGNRKSQTPLFGKRIVITRARSQAGELARRIEELEGEVIYCPAIEIESPESCDALDRAIEVIQIYDGLIFTSVNGVERFLMRLQRLSGSLSKLTGTQIAAIGPQTAARLAREGFKPAVVPKRYLAQGILHLLTPDMMRGKRVLDTTTIDLCLSLFPWASFRATKAAIKWHTLLDLRGAIRSFLHISNGKVHDVPVLDLLLPEPGAFYVMDRGHLDFARLYALQQAGSFFVIRAKSNFKCRRVYSPPRSSDGAHLRSGHRTGGVLLSAGLSRAAAPHPLSRGRRQPSGVLDQSLHAARSHRVSALPSAMADRALLQVDQTAPADQALLRHVGQCGQNPNLDCRGRLRPGSHRPQAVESQPLAACDLTDPERDAL